MCLDFNFCHCTIFVGDCQGASVGDIVKGQVRNIIPGECVLVSFGAGMSGRADIMDTSDGYVNGPFINNLHFHQVCLY